MVEKSADASGKGVGETRQVAPSCRLDSTRLLRTRRLCSRWRSGSNSVGGWPASAVIGSITCYARLNRHDPSDLGDAGFEPALNAHRHGHAGGWTARARAFEEDLGGAVRGKLEQLTIAAVHLQGRTDAVEGILDPAGECRSRTGDCVHCVVPWMSFILPWQVPWHKRARQGAFP